MPDTGASYLVPVPFNFPSVVLGLEKKKCASACILSKASIAVAFECSHVVISSFLSHLSGLTD